MARVTIEDSLKTIREAGGGQFHMILLAAYRAHQLQHGALPKVPENGDKPTVIALREIAAGHYDFTDEIIPKKDVYGQVIEEPQTAEQSDNPKLQGPEVNKPRHWGTGNTQYTAGEEKTDD